MPILWKIGERNSIKSVDDWKCRYIIGLLCAGSRSVYENIGAICSKLKNLDWISSQAAAQCFNFSFSSSVYFYSHFFIVFFLQNIISVPVFYGGYKVARPASVQQLSGLRIHPQILWAGLWGSHSMLMIPVDILSCFHRSARMLFFCARHGDSSQCCHTLFKTEIIARSYSVRSFSFHSANFTNRFLECRWEESWIQITGMI